jgi:E3 ubiquitin-protein ligase BRE1
MLDPDSVQMNADPQPWLKGKSDTAKIEQLQKQLTKDQETIKDLKSQLKKSNNEMKERSLLLEMYKTCTKEIRDKAQLMAAEKRAR